METDKYTNKELTQLEEIESNLILFMFDTKDKRYCIRRALKSAFQLGKRSSYNIGNRRSKDD